MRGAKVPEIKEGDFGNPAAIFIRNRESALKNELRALFSGAKVKEMRYLRGEFEHLRKLQRFAPMVAKKEFGLIARSAVRKIAGKEEYVIFVQFTGTAAE
jgi:hypothetical protein